MNITFGNKMDLNKIRFACVIIITFVSIQLFVSSLLFAADKPVPKSESADAINDAKLAKELLSRAVEFYKEKKDQALAAFMRQGKFTRGDLYVYVISNNGSMLASGGSSAALVGRDVSGMRDADGKLLFREILDTVKSKESGTVEYRWLNRKDRKVERKVTYFQKVDDVIIAVGYYIPRASAAQAKVMLNKASDAVKADAKVAFQAFSDLNGKFIEDDLYVFVVGLDDMSFRAHGATPRLVGSDAKTLTDPNGKLIIQEMISIVKSKGQGELDYAWRNPVTNKIEKKHTFVRKVDNFLVGVGYYTR